MVKRDANWCQTAEFAKSEQPKATERTVCHRIQMMSLKKKKKVVYYANTKNKLLTNFDLKANEQLCKTIQAFIAYCFFLYWLKYDKRVTSFKAIFTFLRAIFELKMVNSFEVRVQCCQLPVGASSDRLTPQLLHAEVGYDRFHLWDQHCLIDSTVGRC